MNQLSKGKSGQIYKIDRYQYSESDLLGEGSFGKVYKGYDTKSKQFVALKFMDMKQFTDQFLQDSLKAEIAIMKDLINSPNVVQLIEVLGDKNQTIIIIELCDGGDLRGFLEKQGGMLEEVEAVKVLEDLMKGFQEMVKHGYIHRDIKPENALINKNIFKVADFGFATKVDLSGLQLMKECVGTPLYMAPQLLERRPYTAKSDIWSIGILAYELVYGRQPWPCRDCNSYLKNIKSMPLKFPYERERVISQDYKDFIKQCLIVDEQYRIDWKDVFKHPVLYKKFNEREYNQQDLDEKTVEILQGIQYIVHVKHLDIVQIFNDFDTDKGGLLDKYEFNQFISFLDPRVTSGESNHLFCYFDKDGSGSLNIEEFKKIFCELDFSDLKDRACINYYVQQINLARLILDLREIIKHNNFNLKQLFTQFDQDQQGDLDIQEFAKLIRSIAPAIRDTEISQIFNYFDQNNDKKISFDEFKSELQYALPNQDSTFDPQREKSLRVISELKRIVTQNKLNIQQIFSNFDKNKSKTLDFLEFQKLCLVMDKTLSVDESKNVFRIFDANKDGVIDFSEFSSQFQ